MDEASVRSEINPVFLLLAMALRIGPLRRVATASRTGPRSTWRPAGGACGMRALEIPPTTAPSSPPVIASDVPEDSSLVVFSESSVELLESCEDWLCDSERSEDFLVWLGPRLVQQVREDSQTDLQSNFR